jgi:hypothetical protein
MIEFSESTKLEATQLVILYRASILSLRLHSKIVYDKVSTPMVRSTAIAIYTDMRIDKAATNL